MGKSLSWAVSIMPLVFVGCTSVGRIPTDESPIATEPAALTQRPPAPSATATSRSSATAPISSTETRTPSPAFTPTPTPAGGGLIRYFGFDSTQLEGGGWQCGVMTANGVILDQRPTFGDVHYCPDGSMVSGDPEWSPDGQRYVYYQGSLLLGESDSSNVQAIGVFEPVTDPAIGIPHSPPVDWLGDNRLFYFDEGNSNEIIVINPATHGVSSTGPYRGRFDRHEPAISPSPDGEMLVVQSWPTDEMSRYELIGVNDATRAVVMRDLASGYGISFDASRRAIWSPDSSRFAIAGWRDDRVIWAIINRDGSLQSILDSGGGPHFGYKASWTANGGALMVSCNHVEMGRYSEYDVCVLDSQGGVVRVFEYQDYWAPLDWSQWSEDGNYLYYMLKAGPYVFPAQLWRMDIRTGSREMVLEGLLDYDWIDSRRFAEWYAFTGVGWSPDGNWMILNNSGPQETLPTHGRPNEFTTSLLCEPSNSCRQMRSGPLVVLGAGWWAPPSSWSPCPLPAVSSSREWDFVCEGNTEGWVPWNELTPLQALGGELHTRSIGADPHMVSAPTAIDVGGLPAIEVRMSVTEGQTGQIFFATWARFGFAEERSLSFPIVSDGQFHTYVLDMSNVRGWQGIVTQIRLDPTDTEAQVAVDYIRLVSP